MRHEALSHLSKTQACVDDKLGAPPHCPIPMRFVIHALPIAVLGISLSGCGGSGDGPGEPPSAPPDAAVKMARCFELAPGVSFWMSDGSSVKVVAEQSEGATRMGYETRSNATSPERYVDLWSVDGAAVRFHGWNQYVPLDRLVQKVTFGEGYRLPLSALPGQRNDLTFVRTDAAGMHMATSSWTFEGFENLNLAGQVFGDTCRFSVVNRLGLGDETVWFARGFGVVRSIDNKTMKQSALDKVLSQS